MTSARTNPEMAWNMKAGPIRWTCLYPIIQRCRWITADVATMAAPKTIPARTATRAAGAAARGTGRKSQASQAGSGAAAVAVVGAAVVVRVMVTTVVLR